MGEVDMEIIKIKLSKCELENASIMEKLDTFGDKLEALSIKMAQLPDEILKRADERYADKNAERVVYAMVGAICLAFILALWEMLKK